MIIDSRNKRKKKKDVTEGFQNLSTSRKKVNANFGRAKKYGGEEDFQDAEELRESLNPRLARIFDSQVNEIQTQADNRQAAEESNLDVLDRGSRYTRKNKKLKKFKV